jgi:restriction system protein
VAQIIMIDILLGGDNAVVIALGELTDTARPYATQHRIAVWQAADLAYALRGPAPGPSTVPD